jgi:mRNA-degrading endonuclease RelE of RelBE toxin-antitoxin system
VKTVSGQRDDPECGEPLERELAGYLKFKLRGFRIVYRVDRPSAVVRIAAIGNRATVYQQLAEQYLQRGRAEEDT